MIFCSSGGRKASLPGDKQIYGHKGFAAAA
jgi:hypothetical protein